MDQYFSNTYVKHYIEACRQYIRVVSGDGLAMYFLLQFDSALAIYQYYHLQSLTYYKSMAMLPFVCSALCVV